MKRVLFGIFAHPDDEAFGPSGLLYKTTQSGDDVHLVLVTDGDAGINSGYDDLASVRLAEWGASGKLMGATTQTAFHYGDGTLSNNVYEEIAGKMLQHVEAIVSRYDEPVVLDFLTFEPGGLTGHIDHIAVSFMTTYVYERLLDSLPSGASRGRLKYYCLSREQQPTSNTDWIYMPAGRVVDEVDEIVDCADVWDKKLEIMSVHVSQRHDMEAQLRRLEEQEKSFPGTTRREYFLYYKSIVS